MEPESADIQDTVHTSLEVDQLTGREVFTKLITSPRQVFRFINDTGYDKFVIPLLVLSGISRSLAQAHEKNMGDNHAVWTIIASAVILGGLFGWISLYFYAALVNWTGKWLNGRGNTNTILMMFSYAMMPYVIALIVLIPQILIYGTDFFRSEDMRLYYDGTSNVIFNLSLILEAILGIWTICLFVIGTSEVQKLTIGKAILNLVLPVFVFIGIILLLVLLFKSISAFM